MRLPSGLNATLWTPFVCPLRVASSFVSWANTGEAETIPRQATPNHSIRRQFVSGLGQAAGRLDDLLQAAGDLQFAKGIRCEPLVIVEFVVQNYLAAAPARRE